MLHEGHLTELKRDGSGTVRPAITGTRDGSRVPPGKYGGFSPDGLGYVVTDDRAPAPWANVVSDGRYGFVVSHNGGGFSWFDDAQHNVLTRWEMDLVRDDRGKLLYLHDQDSNQTWSAAPAPCFPRYDSFECEHRVGQSTFATAVHGIEVRWTMGLAFGRGAEVWTVRVRNASDRTRRLRACSFLEFCCGVAPDAKREFHKLFITTAYDSQRNAVFATKKMWDLPGGGDKEHWNRPWPYVAAHAMQVVDGTRSVALGDKTAFLGRYTSPASPAALAGEAELGAGCGLNGDAAAALGADLVIEPGGEACLHFVLAIAETREQLEQTLDGLSSFESAEAALRGSESRWADLLRDVEVRSELPDFDLLNTTWLPYQAMSARLFGRTGYYQQSGAFGFRDQLQDSQVWLARKPERTASQIELHASRQFASGAVEHWWHALANFGNPTECSDDYLWLPFVVANYLRETGDWTLLEREAPFLDTGGRGTILDHCTRSLTKAAAGHSERGLPLIGACDWNDGLSACGVDGRGESVWLAFFQIDILKDWAHIASVVGDAALASRCESERERLVAVVNAHAWDGEWFRRATTDGGRWLGSSASGEGEIYLNPQTWAVMTGASTPERLRTAWQSVKSRLLTDAGPLLLAPAYTVPDASIGYITRYPPGSRENGGVYTHAATWALAAACKMREPEVAERIWQTLSPITRSAGREDEYVAEPYVLPGNSDGPLAPVPGRAGWTWYTGSAAWLNRVSVDWVAGVRATWDGLEVDPCPLPSMGQTEVARMWRGRRVVARFDSAGFSREAKPRVTLNGVAHDSKVICESDLKGGGPVSIEVSWADDSREPKPLATEAHSHRSRNV
ncbi:MAG: GH36-type glycosyl hydrolase domain-containing protein [Phycisphaerales bacterium JB054]